MSTMSTSLMSTKRARAPVTSGESVVPTATRDKGAANALADRSNTPAVLPRRKRRRITAADPCDSPEPASAPLSPPNASRQPPYWWNDASCGGQPARGQNPVAQQVHDAWLRAFSQMPGCCQIMALVAPQFVFGHPDEVTALHIWNYAPTSMAGLSLLLNSRYREWFMASASLF